MNCPECLHSKTVFLLNSEQARKSFFYNGYDVDFQENAVMVTYKWNKTPDGLLDIPNGGPLDENYNGTGYGNYAYHIKQQRCEDSDQQNLICPSGYEPFIGQVTGPTAQSSAVANAGTSNGAGLAPRYAIDDIMYAGVQEWALLYNENGLLNFGTIIGPNKGSNVDSKHSALHTRGPRLGFRIAMVSSEQDPSPCIACPQKGIIECFNGVGDSGYVEVCPDMAEDCEDPITIPAIMPDDDGRGYVNYGILVQSNLVTTSKYLRFLNSIAVNDYYGGEDLKLWDHSMMPNIKRIEHSDPIHKYSYIGNPEALSQPVTNVNLYGAAYYTKWINAYFCIPFKYSQYELDNNPELSNCEDCVDLIDDSTFYFNGD